MPPKHSYRANGKVLVSGEYLVMDGALALGLPLSLGQSMTVKETAGSDVVWQSHLPSGELWFSGKFDLFGFEPIKASDELVANQLKDIFEAAVRLNSDFLSKWKKYTVQTFLDFEPEWGLGSSSTLISCMADWADVDAYELLQATFGGSGYDIACAKADGPIFYQLDDSEINVAEASFTPPFKDQVYFVYLGAKTNSRSALANYDHRKVKSKQIDEVSQISKLLCDVDTLDYFEELISDHERLVSEVIDRKRVKKEYFADFWGEIKSLGAWGGDFILVTSNRPADETRAYFNQKGFDVFFQYDELAIGQTA